MPGLPILNGLKNTVSHLVDNSSKIFSRIRFHTDGKSHKEETPAQTQVSSHLPQKEKESSDKQQAQTSQTIAEAAKDEGTGEATPDVLLDVPTLKVGELKLNLDDLDAQVALQSDLGNLIRINVGVRVNIKKLDLDLKGVDAKAVLKVRLKEVNKIFSKAFESLEHNPEILAALTSSLKDGLKTTDINKNETGDSIEGNSCVNSQETRHRFRIDE